MALKYPSTSILAGAIVLLLSGCGTFRPLDLGTADLLQQPEHFDQRHVKVSGCLLSHTIESGEERLMLASTCDLAVTSDFNLVSAKVLDIALPSGQPAQGLPLGPTTLDATFRHYGRDPLNINLWGISRVGELVLASN